MPLISSVAPTARIRCSFLSLGIVLVAMLSACEKKAVPPALAKPVEAPFIEPLVQPIPVYQRYAANTAARETVDIVARTRGFIRSIHFIDGQFVNKGDLLYELEETYNQADVESATANLTIAEATTAKALLEYRRQQTLLKQKLTSQENLDKARLNYQQAKAEQQKALAVLNRATQELKYTRIEAPFSGRMSRTAFYPGELVDPDGTSGTTTLTSIARLDPLYVYVQVPSNKIQSILLARDKQGELPVRMQVSSDEKLEAMGTVDFINNRANAATGTLEIRALIENPKLLIYPGQFGYLYIQTGEQKTAMLLPKSSVLEDFNGNYVYRIDQKTLARNDITVVDTLDNWFSVKGIRASDKVIYGDMPLMYSGLRVDPKKTKLPAKPPMPAELSASSGRGESSGRSKRSKDAKTQSKKEVKAPVEASSSKQSP